MVQLKPDIVFPGKNNPRLAILAFLLASTSRPNWGNAVYRLAERGERGIALQLVDSSLNSSQEKKTEKPKGRDTLIFLSIASRLFPVPFARIEITLWESSYKNYKDRKWRKDRDAMTARDSRNEEKLSRRNQRVSRFSIGVRLKSPGRDNDAGSLSLSTSPADA